VTGVVAAILAFAAATADASHRCAMARGRIPDRRCGGAAARFAAVSDRRLGLRRVMAAALARAH
jgi:hypothetical protein